MEKFLSFYANDATRLGEPGPPWRSERPAAGGRRQYWTAAFALPEIQAKVATTSVDVAKSGDIAYELGTFEESFKDPKGKPVNISGKYVVVWKKQANGQWKAFADIFNANQ